MRTLSLALRALALCALARGALGAVAGDIAGDYRLWSPNGASSAGCPDVIRHAYANATSAGDGFLRVFHNATQVSGALCASTAAQPYTVLLDSDTLVDAVDRNADLFPLSSNADQGLLELLVQTRALVGAEAFGDRVCGPHTFRRGTLVAFVRNSTAPAPELGLPGLLDGDRFLLMLEGDVPARKRCVYRAAAPKPPRKRPACFPAAARVALHGGAATRMDTLAHGAAARVARGGAASSVMAFSHRERGAEGAYVRLTAEGGAQLALSAGHYVFSGGALKKAGAVRVGDAIDTETGSARVARVERAVVLPGRFAPHTLAGELVVDGFRVSCYTDAVHPRLAHRLLAPVRALWHLSGGWGDRAPGIGWLHADSALHALAGWLPSGPAELEW